MEFSCSEAIVETERLYQYTAESFYFLNINTIAIHPLKKIVVCIIVPFRLSHVTMFLLQKIFVKTV